MVVFFVAYIIDGPGKLMSNVVSYTSHRNETPRLRENRFKPKEIARKRFYGHSNIFVVGRKPYLRRNIRTRQYSGQI